MEEIFASFAVDQKNCKFIIPHLFSYFTMTKNSSRKKFKIEKPLTLYSHE